MIYKTFEIAIANGVLLKFINVVACDMASALADIAEAYGTDVDIVSVTLL